MIEAELPLCNTRPSYAQPLALPPFLRAVITAMKTMQNTRVVPARKRKRSLMDSPKSRVVIVVNILGERKPPRLGAMLEEMAFAKVEVFSST